jgi:transposase
MIGLLVGLGGYAIGYDIFEGNTYEGHTLIPFLEAISRKFQLGQPVVIADAGLLTGKNITALQEAGYEYIIGARLKNESEAIKEQIIRWEYQDGAIRTLVQSDEQRVIVQYLTKRAKKDKRG